MPDVKVLPMHAPGTVDPLQPTIDQWATQLFGDRPLSHQITWTPGAAYHVHVYDAGQLVSFLKIVRRTVAVNDAPILAGGIGAVMTPPQFAKRGYASLALDKAREIIHQQMNARLGILVCSDDMLDYYAKRGWIRVPCPVTIDQPAGRQTWPQNAMILPRPNETWEIKTLDFCGYPW